MACSRMTTVSRSPTGARGMHASDSLLRRLLADPVGVRRRRPPTPTALCRVRGGTDGLVMRSPISPSPMRKQPRELCAADLVYPLGSGAAAETAEPQPIEVAMERVNDVRSLIGEAQEQALGRDPAQVAAEVCKCCNCGKLARPRNSLWLCSGCRTVMCASAASPRPACTRHRCADEPGRRAQHECHPCAPEACLSRLGSSNERLAWWCSYCSRDCQRVHWYEGNHAAMCRTHAAAREAVAARDASAPTEAAAAVAAAAGSTDPMRRTRSDGSPSRLPDVKGPVRSDRSPVARSNTIGLPLREAHAGSEYFEAQRAVGKRLPEVSKKPMYSPSAHVSPLKSVHLSS